jgi:3-hydroxyacyl-CoA dehydrogenase/enoyl-CoA hydratase/3-hydroxybutyryl-CoA epimerase
MLEKQPVTTTFREDGVAVLTFDAAGSVNVLNPAFSESFQREFSNALSHSDVHAIVLASAKKDFIVGADVAFLDALVFADDAARLAKELATGLLAVARAPKPVVAAVNGQALGGGFELALAAHAIVLSDTGSVGLPEVKLGLLPGANGLLRVAERAGLAAALDLGLRGRTVRAKAAKELGLVAALAPASVLVDAAAKYALGLVAKKAESSPGFGRGLVRFATEKAPLGRALVFDKARKATAVKTGGHYPATTRILDLLERWSREGFEAAAAVEPAYFGELVVSDASKALRSLFFATTALKKETGIAAASSARARPIAGVCVVGAGLMGAGIAAVSLDAGLAVRLVDRDDAGIGRGLAAVKKHVDQRVKRKRISREEGAATLAKLSYGEALPRTAPLVIEAVYEDLALKHEVLRRVERELPAAIFATNTSAIPVDAIADGATHPENVVGMHYFSPVPKMPLLEVVRGAHTSDEAIATAVSLGKKQGKTVIVVGPGSYTTRVLGAYLNEAAWLLAGDATAAPVAIDAIDRALVQWGFPVGPFQLLDEVGIDVAAQVGEVLRRGNAPRFQPPPPLARLLADGRKGRKNGRGFYDYSQKKSPFGVRSPRQKSVDPSVYDLLGITTFDTRIPREELQMRCALAFVNEAVACLDEGILHAERDGDIGAIFGLGFPAFRGGPFHYVRFLGAAEVVARLRGFEQRFGPRFAPAAGLLAAC